MTKSKTLTAAACGLALLAPGLASAAAPNGLTAKDYIEIEQLSARYAFAIENCTNKGYDYADLYTDDGSFAVAQAWGDPGKVYAAGRDALANADGGGPGGCRDPKTMLGYGLTHIIVDLVIDPTPSASRIDLPWAPVGVGSMTKSTMMWVKP